MMFKNKIPDLSKNKGLMNAFQLGKALGVSPTTASRLWNGDFEKVGIDTLHRLCNLFECQISDYLYYDGNLLPDSFR
jgi:DNA-binding Xre family transcriptional regulator